MYVLIGFIIVIGIWYFFLQIPRPKIMPLEIDKDNPKMVNAIKNAKSNLEEFKKLLNLYPKEAQVKIPFLTSSGENEFIWGNVTKLIENELSIFLITPPISHDGIVNRHIKCDLNNIVDWIIRVPNKKFKGGYTMKVMFEIYKEEYGELPQLLLEEKSKYE